MGCGGCGLFPGLAGGPCLRDHGSGRAGIVVLLLTIGRGHCRDASVAAAGASGHTEGATAACQHCRPETGNGAGKRRSSCTQEGRYQAHPARVRDALARTLRSLKAWQGGGGGWQLLPLLPAECHHQAISPLLSLPNWVSPPSSQVWLRLSLQEADLIAPFSPNCSLTVDPPPSAPAHPSVLQP